VERVTTARSLAAVFGSGFEDSPLGDATPADPPPYRRIAGSPRPTTDLRPPDAMATLQTITECQKCDRGSRRMQ